MYLCETWIAEISTFFMSFPDSSNVTTHGIGRKIKYISITAAAQQHSMTKMSFQFTCDQISCNDATCLSINRYNFKHLMTRIHFHIAQCYLSLESLVCADQ